MTDNIVIGAIDHTSQPISFMMNNECVLKIAKDGFYVRGKRVNQDDNEAEVVYNAFHQWLTFKTLNR